MPRHDPQYVAALQLLLSDMDARDRFLTYQAAFQDSMVFYSMTEMRMFENRMQQVYNLCQDALNRSHPSSGLGVVAVSNLHAVLLDLKKEFSNAAVSIGVGLKNPSK